MSRIYFHSEDGTAGLRGSERAHMGWLCGRLFLASIGSIWDTKEDPSWLRKYVPPDHYALNPRLDFKNSIDTWLSVGQGDLIIEGQAVSVFSLALNTACMMGNNAIKLCARLHGQCEIHSYVEGPNRAWLADMIEVGRKQNIFRSDMGWEAIVELLRSSDAKPVVTSYSVTEQFPNADVAVAGGLWELTEEERETGDWDRWYDLPREEQWRLAMTALRAKEGWLELKPEGWQEYYFDEGITGFDLSEKR